MCRGSSRLIASLGRSILFLGSVAAADPDHDSIVTKFATAAVLHPTAPRSRPGSLSASQPPSLLPRLAGVIEASDTSFAIADAGGDDVDGVRAAAAAANLHGGASAGAGDSDGDSDTAAATGRSSGTGCQLQVRRRGRPRICRDASQHVAQDPDSDWTLGLESPPSTSSSQSFHPSLVDPRPRLWPQRTPLSPYPHPPTHPPIPPPSLLSFSRPLTLSAVAFGAAQQEIGELAQLS